MLVLTRKYQEKIRIGENITITVLRTKGKAVRLGIEAPSDINVIRGELAFEPAKPSADVAASIEPVPARSASEAAVAARRCSVPAWDAESTDPVKPQVRLHRVPRATRKEILPQLEAGAAPLRAMMHNK
jgi:carbon storage regulator CsrA